MYIFKIYNGKSESLVLESFGSGFYFFFTRLSKDLSDPTGDIHVLCLNAGIMMGAERISADGFDLQLLQDRLVRLSPARVFFQYGTSLVNAFQNAFNTSMVYHY